MGVSPFPYGRVWFKNVHARIVYELETYYSFFFETSEYQSALSFDIHFLQDIMYVIGNLDIGYFFA